MFQSDPSNADVLLGKTAHYDPQNFEVYLYVDKRHPKDILRSLSHELVHHAQNCRGDFANAGDTSPGYAQRDPHMRKMEREAYTKGNLIFRDFEDLIKTGKIAVDIDFKKSGEPKMSLKEWKNDELNTLLMKKWGLLSEGTAKEREDEEGNRPSDDKEMDLDEGGWDRRGPRKKRGWGLDEEKGHEGSCEEVHAGKDHDEYMAGLRGQGGGPGDEHYQFGKKEREAELEEGEIDEAYPQAKERGRSHDLPDPEELRKALSDDPEEEEEHRARPTPRRSRPPHAGSVFRMREDLPAKISVREAKEITRKVIERLRKEGK